MGVGGRWAARLLAGISLLVVAAPATPSETITYQYDARGRLVKVTHAGSVNNGVAADYTYDKADNRSNVTVTAGGPPLPSFSVNDVTVTEGATLNFTVSKSGTTLDTLDVSVATADGSAVAGTDYTAASSVLTFAPADTTTSFSVTTTNNGTVNGTRALYVNLSNPSVGAAISDSQGVGTINDDEVAVIPSFSVADVSANEGSSLTFTVTKTGLTNLTYTINYATANGGGANGAIAGTDYTAKSGTLTFAPTDTQKTVTVPTTNDTTPENDETFAFNLSGASGGATIIRGATGTIVNNDGVGFTISDAYGTEGELFEFFVTKVGSTTATLTVNFATADSSAIAPGDYTATSGQLSFTPSATSRVISVQTIRNLIIEGDELFLVNLSKPAGQTYSFIKATGSGNVANYCNTGC